MNIFVDWHHGGLGRSLVLVLEDRLGHKVYGPSHDLCEFGNVVNPGTWLHPNVAGSGGVPDKHLNEHKEIKTVTKDQFMSMDWDAVVITRPESVTPIRMLLDQHPNGSKVKRIGQAGNEGQTYDWGYIPNFMSSDYLSYLRAPHDINKIHYMQEIGRQFQPDKFTPLTEESLHTINTFINCLSSFNGWSWNHEKTWWGERCPHCDTNEPSPGLPVSVAGIWQDMKISMPDRKFNDYGINNSGGMISELFLPDKIKDGALTWGFKTYDGFGHSIAQSVSMGRLCIAPRRFHKYRTASQFLIPNLTCLEAEWSAESCKSVIDWFTASLDRANDYSEACFNAAKGIFNWGHEAFRVKEFLSQLR